MLNKWKSLSSGNADSELVLQAYWFSGVLAGIGCTLLTGGIIVLIAN